MPTDSSPVTSTARRFLEIAASALSSRVDFPTPGLPADEHERGRHEPAAEHAVELWDAGRNAVGLLGLDVD